MSAKDFMSGGLVSNAYREQEDADPRVGLVNLADVMLVFACGLMLALVSYWNLDVGEMSELIQAGEMSEVSDIQDLADQMNEGGSGFTELGMVYQDPMTGKMYMLAEDLESSAQDGSGSTAGEAGTADTADAAAASAADGSTGDAAEGA